MSSVANIMSLRRIVGQTGLGLSNDNVFYHPSSVWPIIPLAFITLVGFDIKSWKLHTQQLNMSQNIILLCFTMRVMRSRGIMWHVTFSVFYLIDILIRRGTFCWKPHPNRTSGSKALINWRIPKTIENMSLQVCFITSCLVVTLVAADVLFRIFESHVKFYW